ncbi:hypothetical protein CEXT_332771, partial [Caerostris extrusa]
FILYRGWLAEIENRKSLDLFERDPNTKLEEGIAFIDDGPLRVQTP